MNLPQTKFNMRANSTQKEPEIQRRWQENRVYEQLVESNPGPIYTLHDGPPYANGFVTRARLLRALQLNLLQILKGRCAVFWDRVGGLWVGGGFGEGRAPPHDHYRRLSVRALRRAVHLCVLALVLALTWLQACRCGRASLRLQDWPSFLSAQGSTFYCA